VPVRGILQLAIQLVAAHACDATILATTVFGIMRRYAIVIERALSNFAAYVPDLPGCVATGATVEETERLLRESIAIHLQRMEADGLPIPEPSSVVDYLELEAGTN
jgi:predicted RNase H-like HicB family nuclease